MHKRKVVAKAKKGEKPQLGIFSGPDFDDDDDGDDNEDDLEAELNAILASNAPLKPRQKPKVQVSELEKMVAESMKDIPSDAELSGDDDDPELLEELSTVVGDEVISPIQKSENIAPTFQNQDFINILNERIQMYKIAEENAKTTGEASKQRRLARGLKTLEDLHKKAKAGFAINENDIPLPVSVTLPKKEETPIFDPIVDGEPVEKLIDFEDNPKIELIKQLNARKDEYKNAALIAKKSGEIKTAILYVKIVKQFETVIAGVESGHPVDLSSMPGPPGSEVKTEKEEIPQVQPEPEPIQPEPESIQPQPSEAPTEIEPKVIKIPETILEALEQRLAKYKESEEAGKRDGNAGKVRRMGRIIKQYEDAIKLHKAGKPFPVEDLPTPPDFPPIPVAVIPAKLVPSPGSSQSPVPPPRAQVAPVSPISPAPSAQGSSQGTLTRQEKQLAILKLKQKQFKEAAVKAKQSGNIELAKELLRKVKCFDPLIDATISGLPVDMSTLPAHPGSNAGIEKDYEIIKLQDCIPGSTSEIYHQLITDLSNQLKSCMETRAHYKAQGDVANANKFENLAVNTKKDLDSVKIACNKDDPVPRFHYEMRTFSIVRCNTDLTDNDVELTIIQGINYNVPNPKEIDTYVRYEFPYPTDDPPKDKSQTVYNTNNPEYHKVVIFGIQRANRACQRIFKRQSIKLEVWSKGYVLSALCGLCTQGNSVVRGFLRSDSLVGTVNVKLLPLETHCTIHDSYDLMNGKKVLGGKLEVKVRVRHPIMAKQIEQVKEKWLIID